ncbi:Chaperone protein DnaJ 2 [Leucoagaricus sp. SymC.cos]|nr:Chaperone protein DnaJ 2 [Leucoagaricus sp. SymC.cos]
MSTSRNNYRILGISSNAAVDEIKQAYKTMALRWHPDRHPDNTELATMRFLEVQEAYQMLMQERYPLGSALLSSVHQRSESVSTYESGTCFSASTSTLGSFIHVSASSTESLMTSATTVKSSAPSYKSYPSDSPWYGMGGPTGVYHPPRYAHSFTIVPPARKPRTPPSATSSWDHYALHERHQTLCFRSLGIGPAKEWIYGLALTLEELLIGKHCSFSLSRNFNSGKRKTIVLDVDIPPGCREGMRILCRGVGHERKDGSRQDIAFIIEEIGHDHFSRAYDDLLLDVKIPWDDSLRHQVADFVIDGLDGQNHSFRVDYPRDRMLKGKSVIRGAGMPIRSGGKVIGRGNLFVQWEIIAHHPKVLNFMKRFMHFRR